MTVYPSINCFCTAKNMLDWIYEQIPSKDRDDIILQSLKSLSYSYQKRSSNYKMYDTFQPIDYGKIETQFAYTYAYTPAHADVIFQLLSSCKEAKELFSTQSVNVSCLGGGPGGDLLGVAKFIDFWYNHTATRKNTSLNCNIYDRERAWYGINSYLTSLLQKNMSVSSRFYSFDIKEEPSSDFYEKVGTSDLITMSFFLSEFVDDRYTDSRASKIFQQIFKHAKWNAMFLFIDNSSDHADEWFDEMIRDFNRNDPLDYIEVLPSTLPSITFIQVGYEEEKKDLGIYYKKFYEDNAQGHCPRLTIPLTFRICQKVASF